MDLSQMSDEELQKLAGGGNDMSAMSDEELEKIANPPGMLESGLRGAAQGATLGFADEIAGGVESLFTDKTYDQARDESRSNFKRAKDANPSTYLTGEVGGGLATALAGGAPATLAKGVIAGAGLGGLAGIGGSEGEDAIEVTKDGLKGAGIGAAGGAVAHGVSKAVPWAMKSAGEKLKALAEMRAVKSLGGSKKAMEALKRTDGAEARLGRNLLDKKVVSPFASKETMASRLDDAVMGSTDDLSGELKRVSELQGRVTPEQALQLEASKFNPKASAEALKGKMAEDFSMVPQKIRDSQGEVIDEWLSQPGSMDVMDAQKFKTQMQKWIKDPAYHNSNPGVAQETLKGIRSQIKSGIEKNADTAAEIFGEQGGKIKNINQDLGGMFQGQDMLEDAVARGSKNRTFSLTDYVSGNAGAAGAGPIGWAAALGNKVVREKGSQISAVTMDKASKMLLKSPRFAQLAQQNPKAFNAMANDMARRMSAGDIGRVADGFDPTQPVSEDKAKQSFLEGN